MGTLRRIAFRLIAVVSTTYTLLLGVYAVATTQPELNTQPKTFEEVRDTVAKLGIEDEYAFSHGFVDARRGRMHYAETGSGNPVLFLHGSPTWSYLYRHLMSQLASEGRMIAPDLLGFGLSEKPPRGYTVDASAEDLLALVEKLDLRNLVLVVHDWGGPIGMALWLRAPERIRGIVVLNTFGFQSASGSLASSLARDFVRTPLVGEQLVQGLEGVQRVWLPLTLDLRSSRRSTILRSYSKVQGSWSERAGTLAFARLVPRDTRGDAWILNRAEPLLTKQEPRALIVWGMRDRVFGPAALREWRTALPSAHVEEIEGAGAMVPEEAPEVAAAAIAGFLRQL